MDEKALVYHGKVESLARQVAESQDRLNQRYLEVFGEKNYSKLADASAKLLTTESYINTSEELHHKFGIKPSEKSCSKIILLTDADFSLRHDKKIKQKKIRLAPAFYVSDESFKHSGASHYTDKILASYVHEFNHFAWLVLQKTPFYLVESAFSAELGTTRSKEDLDNLIQRLEIETARPLQQRRELLASSISAYMMHAGFEQANRILDYTVLSSIGINAAIPYRKQKKQFMQGCAPKLEMIFVFPIGGDYYCNMSDKQAIHNFLNWEDHLNLKTNSRLISTIIDSVKSVQVQLLPLAVLNKEREADKDGTK